MSEKTQATVLKFLHCGDVHLDTPFTGLSPEKSDERRIGLRHSFMKMMEYVRGAGINYVLISGDLFENDCATGGTAELLIREFMSSPNTKFIIAPGKHDAYNGNLIYTSGRLPENCYLFTSDKIDRFDFAEDRVVIYGWAFLDKSITSSPLYDRRVGDSSMINIVCGYADLDAPIGSHNCPVSTTDLKKFGADYPVSIPEYGVDGRVTTLATNKAITGSYDGTSFMDKISIIGENGQAATTDKFMGVRAIGTASGASPAQLDYKAALVAASSAMTDATKKASGVLTAKGGALADIAIKKVNEGDDAEYDIDDLTNLYIIGIWNLRIGKN